MNFQQELSGNDSELKWVMHSHSQTLTRRPNEDFLSSLFRGYSSWERLKRAVAWFLRFKSWFVGRYSQRSTHVRSKSLTVDEVQTFEREITKYVQRISFPEVLLSLQRISSLPHLRQVSAELKELKMSAYMRKLHPSLALSSTTSHK